MNTREYVYLLSYIVISYIALYKLSYLLLMVNGKYIFYFTLRNRCHFPQAASFRLKNFLRLGHNKFNSFVEPTAVVLPYFLTALSPTFQ